jgi:hypothetical protein
MWHRDRTNKGLLCEHTGIFSHDNANETDITEFPITESMDAKTLYVTFWKPSVKYTKP